MRIAALLALAALAAAAFAEAPARLNEIRVLGSHNSYKRAIDPALLAMIAADDPRLAAALDYAHVPLTEQLDLGLRQLELDVFRDLAGGRYAHPAGLARIAAPAPYDTEAMEVPGFKVLHVQDIDFRSHCPLLRDCLTTLVRWSQANAGHSPVFVTMNAKDAVIDVSGFVRPLPFTASAFDALDALLRDVLGEALFEPDALRGEHASLPAAIADDGWPYVGDLAGRFVFVLDESDETLAQYLDGHPALRGRAMFANAPEDSPAGAIRIVNDPIASNDYIGELVRRGFIVRTRADADTAEARSGDTRRRDAAFESGAQIVSTDYYLADERFGHGYQVALPGHKAGTFSRR